MQSTFNSSIRNINWPQLDTSNTRNYETDGTFVNVGYTTYDCYYELEEIGTATDLDLTFKAGVRKLPKSAVRCVNIAPTGTIGKEELAQALMIAQTRCFCK